MSQENTVISVKGLKKAFGKNQVLKGVNFEVRRGTILALLGPNGAGKTTAVRILSTLLKADSGTLLIEGNDVAREPDKVRLAIGLTGQSAAVDELLTGRENLIMMGRLYRLTKASAVTRAEDLLRDFDLTEAANRPVKTYSGGMRRRLDLAVSLIATPPVIFLDEPTTGLDPRSRIAMWEIINDLKAKGATILLTTQYLEEADQLADRVIVIDGGKVIAEGTPTELKAKIGNDRLELTFAKQATFAAARRELGKTVIDENAEELTLTILIVDPNADVKKTLDALAGANIRLGSIAVHKPTLDDVFMSLTGKVSTKSKPGDADKTKQEKR